MRGSVSRRLFWLCPAVALVLVGSAYGAAFTNGSFEAGSINPGVFTALGTGSTTITGWTVRSAGVDYIGTYWVAQDGARSVDLSATAAGGIEQTFDTETGVHYTVTFYFAGNPTGCGSVVKGMDVGATGNPTAHYTFDVTGHSTVSMGWQQETYTFVAAGTSTTLFFQSTENSGCGPAVDNVSMITHPVPVLSPAMGAVLALLIAMLALPALRRRPAV
jgi:choice-of-anchor C domain-containing protein